MSPGHAGGRANEGGVGCGPPYSKVSASHLDRRETGIQGSVEVTARRDGCAQEEQRYHGAEVGNTVIAARTKPPAADGEQTAQ